MSNLGQGSIIVGNRAKTLYVVPHAVQQQHRKAVNIMQMLSFKQVTQLIKAIGHKRTIIVEGENGIGKTGLFHMLKDDPFFSNHVHVDPIDCTQSVSYTHLTLPTKRIV